MNLFQSKEGWGEEVNRTKVEMSMAQPLCSFHRRLINDFENSVKRGYLFDGLRVARCNHKAVQWPKKVRVEKDPVQVTHDPLLFVLLRFYGIVRWWGSTKSKNKSPTIASGRRRLKKIEIGNEEGEILMKFKRSRLNLS